MYIHNLTKNLIKITLITKAEYFVWHEQQSELICNWLSVNQFQARAEAYCLLPNSDGNLAQVILIQANEQDFWGVGHLAKVLPPNHYELDLKNANTDFLFQAAIAWGLGSYQFTRYKENTKQPALLYLPETVNRAQIEQQVKAIYFVRDLINTPTEELGPAELSLATANLAREYGAQFNEIVDEDLLLNNYPLIYAVGKASPNKPRLLDIRWGNSQHTKLTLVGKGVCFDSGGLNIKPSSGMLLMKKDMGGAAIALGLARMIMAAQLPIRLRVLIPAVENSVSGNAYRPGDVIRSRQGLTVEITDTDAEGRLVLADALTEAASENPDLLIDFSTLTGAARVAVGSEISAYFTNDNDLANALEMAAHNEQDPVCRLPLHKPYRKLLDSAIADINNSPKSSYGSAIAAALFLQEFVPDSMRWIHFDMNAWNLSYRSGRPEGGEAMAVRAVFQMMVKNYQSFIS